MKKIIFLAVIFLSTSLAHAVTQVKYLGMMGMIVLTDRVAGTVQDSDPQDLFAKMNVQEQETPQGRGKSIRTEGKALTIICAIRPTAEGTCSIIVKAGPKAVIAPGNIRYEETGAAANELFRQFYSDGNSFLYETTVKDFRVQASPEKFLVEYKSVLSR